MEEGSDSPPSQHPSTAAAVVLAEDRITGNCPYGPLHCSYVAKPTSIRASSNGNGTTPLPTNNHIITLVNQHIQNQHFGTGTQTQNYAPLRGWMDRCSQVGRPLRFCVYTGKFYSTSGSQSQRQCACKREPCGIPTNSPTPSSPINPSATPPSVTPTDGLSFLGDLGTTIEELMTFSAQSRHRTYHHIPNVLVGDVLAIFTESLRKASSQDDPSSQEAELLWLQLQSGVMVQLTLSCS